MPSFSTLLGLAGAAAALPARDISLFRRQDGSCFGGISECVISQDTWNALDLDSHMAEQLAILNPAAENKPLPEVYSFAFTPNDGQTSNLSGCGRLDGNSGSCSDSQAVSDIMRQTCPAINSGPEDRCLRYSDPRAAVVIQNYVAMSATLREQAEALQRARDNLVNQNFVSDLIDGMAEEEGSFIDEITDLVLSIPFAILFAPRAAFEVLFTALSALDDLIVEGGFMPVRAGGAGVGIIEQIQANQEIQDEKERVKDQASRQIDAIVAGERQRIEIILNTVFQTAAENAADANAARNTAAFRALEGGAFLNARPSLDEQTAAAETSIKNTIISGVMNGMGWGMVRTFGLQLEVAGQPGSADATCRDGQKGIPQLLGAPCVLLRRGDDKRMNDPSVLGRFVDLQTLADNADHCSGGQEQNATPLPDCFYKFPVSTNDLSA